MLSTMARPTKQAIEVSRAIGDLLSPSQVTRLTAGGLAPIDDPRIDRLDHWRSLAPLTGTGRDLDIAALKMAGAGFPSSRLRQALIRCAQRDVLSPTAKAAGERMDKAAAQRTVENGTYLQCAGLPEAEDPGAEEQLILSGARYDYETLLTNPKEPYLHDTYDLAKSAADIIAGEPSSDAATFNYEASEAILVQMAHCKKNAPEFLLSTSLLILAKLVQDCARVLETLRYSELKHHYPLGDEDYWRFVGAMVPISRPIFDAFRPILDALYAHNI